MKKNQKKKHDHNFFKASFKKINNIYLLHCQYFLPNVDIHTNLFNHTIHYTAEFYTVILICIMCME